MSLLKYESRGDVAWKGLLTVAAVVVVVHLTCIGRYGFFRDELYYLACAARLDWGFVDHPPFSVALLKAWSALFGESLVAMRFLSVLAGASACVFTGLIAWELGGSSRAQVLAAACVAASPVHRVVSHLYSMNSFDVPLWAAAIWVWLTALRDPKPWRWLVLGGLLGIGFLNKASIVWLVAGLGVAMVATPNRRQLATPWTWAALALTALLALPNVLWQSAHGWPTAEFVQNANEYKMVPISFLKFWGLQAVVTNPVGAVVWLIGLVIAWKKPEIRHLAIVFSVVALILVINGKSRENYLSPAYAAIWPIGAMFLVDQWRNKWATAAVWVGLIGVGTGLVSLALPFWSPETVIDVAEHSPVKPPDTERGSESPMKGHADMFGWPEMSEKVTEVLAPLPSDERARTLVVTYNYGEASALDHYLPADGRGLGVTSGHNTFWFWGQDKVSAWDGRSVVLVGAFGTDVTGMFDAASVVARGSHPLAVPEEAGVVIVHARGLRVPKHEFWAALRRFR